MAHAVSLSYARSDHMSPTAVAMTTALHVAVAAALYWVSPLNYIDTTPDTIAVTMEREVPRRRSPRTPPPPPAPQRHQHPRPRPRLRRHHRPRRLFAWAWRRSPPTPAPIPRPRPASSSLRRPSAKRRPPRPRNPNRPSPSSSSRHWPRRLPLRYRRRRHARSRANCRRSRHRRRRLPLGKFRGRRRRHRPPPGAATDRTARATRADTAAAAAATACPAILAALPPAAAATRPAGFPPGAHPRLSGRHVRHAAGRGALRLAHRPEGVAASAVRAQRHHRGGQPGAAHHDCPRRRLVDVGLSRSSGLPSLDNVSLNMVRQAGPYNPLPDDIPGGQHTFILPLNFKRN